MRCSNPKDELDKDIHSLNNGFCNVFKYSVNSVMHIAVAPTPEESLGNFGFSVFTLTPRTSSAPLTHVVE